MPAATRPRSQGAAPKQDEPVMPALPKITVARFEEATRLVQLLVEEKASIFVKRGQDYRNQYRQQTERPLNAMEIASIATDLQRDMVEVQDQLEQAEVKAFDEPAPQEVLMVAGLATAPEFIEAARRLVALIEMPADEFEEACENETLDTDIRSASSKLRHLELSEFLTRGRAALDHISKASGVGQGGAMGVLSKMVWEAISTATSSLASRFESESQTGSSTSTEA